MLRMIALVRAFSSLVCESTHPREVESRKHGYATTLALIGCVITPAVLLMAVPVKKASERDASAKETSIARVRPDYDLPFNSGIFTPSNADTTTHQFMSIQTFPKAEYCRHCHEATYHQWRQSLHANSFREPFYVKNVNLLIESKGIAYSRHCEGCHNPIALLSGALTTHPASTDRSFDQDGVTCSVCHSIQRLQPAYGLGSYVMGTPAVIVDEEGNPIPGEVPDRMILEHPERHIQAVMKPFYRTPEFCGACHKANLPAILNGYKWLRAFDTYGDWQQSAFSQRSPLPYYTRDYASCQTCHMPKRGIREPDSAAVGGMIASHRWLGGNTAVPFYYGYRDQVQQTEEFLCDRKLTVDIFAIRKSERSTVQGSWLAPIGSADVALKPGDAVQIAVVIQNRGLGHSLVPEQRDIFEAWVEFVVKDEGGHMIAQSGAVGRDGFVDTHAYAFGTKMLDGNGGPLVRHEVWLRHGVAADATIPSGQSAVVFYQFAIPRSASAPLNILAKVRYRHFNEVFTRFVLGNNHPQFPIVDMATDIKTLAIGNNSASGAVPGAEPEWLRWNNFGIGLLNARHFAEAAAAFGRVTELRPDYADAHTNQSLAYAAFQEYDQAQAELTRALQLAPDNLRALCFRGALRRAQGDLRGAASDLAAVAARYPDSPDANRDLGLAEYLRGHFDFAIERFLRVQAEDPDDLASHYYLSLLYSREGAVDLAIAERRRFLDENPYPNDSANTLEILRGMTGMAESPHPSVLHILSSSR